jgi:hypothetical protein
MWWAAIVERSAVRVWWMRIQKQGIDRSTPLPIPALLGETQATEIGIASKGESECFGQFS